MKLLMKAAFNRISGYGNDAVDIARWLDKSEVDVRLMPSNVYAPLPEDFVHLLTKKVPKEGYDFSLQFLPPFDISVRKKLTKAWKKPGIPYDIAERHIGWSMWESSKLEPYDMTGHQIGPHPWKLLDRMYVTWPGCDDAFRHYEPDLEYRVLPCGIDGDLYPVKKRGVTGPTKFVMIGELHQRKDPFVAIQAFDDLRKEKGDDFDAELHLKTNMSGLHPKLSEWNDRISVHKGVWPYEELIEWMTTMHCYVGPSRGEGNLKPPMEFMATGGTVIVTNWGGPRNWLHPDVAYPLDYQLMTIDRNRADGPMNARADKDHLKQLMWDVHTNRDVAAQKGILAADWIRQVSGWPKLIEKLIRELERMPYE